MNLEFKYSDEVDLEEVCYVEFLKEAYGYDGLNRFTNKRSWYQQTKNYRTLLAILDGKVIGHSSFYTVDACINGVTHEFSWGVDGYVLKEGRGKGIGKNLQKKLHEDAKNFSSVWYSPTNGHIKKLCGAKSFKVNHFPYYPISKFFSLYIELAVFKLFRRKIRLNLRLPNFYYRFNKSDISKFTVVQCPNFDGLIDYINSTLSAQYDFFICRDAQYLNWKYFENPNLKGFHILKILNEKKIEAVITFSEANEKTFIAAKYFGVSILDAFIAPNSSFSQKDMITVIVEFYKQKGITIDGIRSISKIPYFPKLIYPKSGTPFLSTHTGKMQCPYLSLMDQDMEQL